MEDIELISELTCPECGRTSSETMSVDNCQYYYECRHCGVLLKPLRVSAVYSAPTEAYPARLSRKRAWKTVQVSGNHPGIELQRLIRVNLP